MDIGFLFSLTKDYKDEADIIKNDSLFLNIRAVTETMLSDSNYIIPVDIVICNYTKNSINIKIGEIEAYLKNSKNERDVFNGLAPTIDTVIKPNGLKTISLQMKFRDFNSSYVHKITDFDNYTMTVFFRKININKLIVQEKKVFFICKTH